jgi:glycosyltransferase involved in cell wall biosynthesis
LLRQTNVVSITKDILEYFNLEKSSKAQVIYNGICSAEDKAEITEKENYFVSACTIAPNKGIQDAITAFEEFYKTHDEYRFYILGNDQSEYAENLKTYVQQKGLSDVIIFKGYQNKEQVYQFMQKAKALVVASYNEGFGRMTAEAAFNGTLVIGRNTAGTKEILDMVGGFPFDGDYIVIAEQMNTVHNLSKEEYNRLAQKAQELAVQQYSTEKNIEKIIDLYCNLI